MPGLLSEAVSRFYAFTPEELEVLWDGLIVDDGIHYAPEAETAEWRLAYELHEMASTRGMVEKDPARWSHML